MAELHQSRLLAKLENLGKQSGKRLQVTLAEVRDGAEIRRIEPDNAHEVDPLARRLGDPARRVDPIAIAVEQQPRHHRRIKRRLPAFARVGRFDGAKIEMLEHKRQNKARKVVLADEVPHAGRQQQRLVDIPGAERLAHEQAESDSRPRRYRIRYFSDRLLRGSGYRARGGEVPGCRDGGSWRGPFIWATDSPAASAYLLHACQQGQVLF